MSAPRMYGHLPRLAPEFYRGRAVVHWVATIEQRATGWLTPLFHARFREAMLHAVVRYELLCPVYCLMPDHAHLIWMGVGNRADQQLAMTFFRTSSNQLLSPHAWQKQSYDHVLRETDRERGAFEATCEYIMQNPVRKNLVADSREYAFSGAVLPGFPNLDPRRLDFWDVFWKVYNSRVSEVAPTR